MKRIFLIVLTLITVSCSVAQPAPIPTTSATIIPPTETAAPPFDLPIPTVVVTETNTPSPTPESKYAIDLNKLNNFPSSYEELLANPGKYQEAPDPFTDINAFNKWWVDLKTAFGDPTQHLPNMNAIGAGVVIGNNAFTIGIDEIQSLNISTTRTFFFIDGNTVYPVIILVPDAPGEGVPYGTFATIVPPNSFQGSDGIDTLSNLFNGRSIIHVAGPAGTSAIPWPEDRIRLMNLGLNWTQDGSRYWIGPADIMTYEY